jgi:predicted nuclease of restriction endonuclease-like (RecB) superfamily
LIGREIVIVLQRGDERAEYRRRPIDALSIRLSKRYGRGYSTTNLRYFRTFHQVHADRIPEIRHMACGESVGILLDLSQSIKRLPVERGFSPVLGWSHYRSLMAIESPVERLFYEIEAEKEGWSVEHLRRQIHVMLFARLLKSRDRAGMMALAREGQEIRSPADTLKDPYVLDFLELPDAGRLREFDLETAIIGQIQAFLLELGKGFAFVARQKRLTYEDKHFYVDLVFYHTILKCYLLIDLKVGELAHQDIGQMDSYVRLYDDQFTIETDNPTIGLILCAEKSAAIARYSVLNENRQIFAARYVRHLPSEAELKREIERERRLIEGHAAEGDNC